MTERYALVEGKPLAYQGLFRVQTLYKTIDQFFMERYWEKNEVKNIEQVEADGRQIIIELFPWKQMSDYCKIQIRVFMVLSGLKDVQIQVDGEKRTYQQGKVSFNFDAYMTTDFEGYWNGRPLQYFFHVIVDKFVRKGQTTEAANLCKKTLSELQDEIKSFLNMHRYLTSKPHATVKPHQRK